MDYRRIGPQDIDQVAEFALRGLRPDRVPLHVSGERIRAVITHFMNSPTDFHLAAFDGPHMVGGIAVAVTPMLWFERCEAHVVMLFATSPGVGFKLLRAAMQWVSRHPSIRRVFWPLEDDTHSDRYARVASRFGFSRSQVVLQAYKE